MSRLHLSSEAIAVTLFDDLAGQCQRERLACHHRAFLCDTETFPPCPDHGDAARYFGTPELIVVVCVQPETSVRPAELLACGVSAPSPGERFCLRKVALQPVPVRACGPGPQARARLETKAGPFLFSRPHSVVGEGEGAGTLQANQANEVFEFEALQPQITSCRLYAVGNGTNFISRDSSTSRT